MELRKRARMIMATGDAFHCVFFETVNRGFGRGHIYFLTFA